MGPRGAGRLMPVQFKIAPTLLKHGKLWSKPIVYFGGAPIENSGLCGNTIRPQIGMQGLGDLHASVTLLVIFHNREPSSTHS